MNTNELIEPKKNISFLVSIPFHKTIDAFCKEHSVSKSLLIRTSLNEMMNQYESAAK
jgi:ribosomal protein L16 Arg81 hydroxylase